MSEIITDKLTGKTSAGDVTITSEGGSATMQLQQGVAKAWVNHSEGTTVRDSFNIASITDDGTGKYTANYTNAMSNGDYTMSGCTEGTGSSNNGNLGVKNDNTALTTTNVAHIIINNSNNSADRDPTLVIVHGDLA